MARSIVQVARMRISDVVPGDVVSRQPEDTEGWFEVARMEVLFDGSISLSDLDRRSSFAAQPMDIVGVQLLKAVEMPTPVPSFSEIEPLNEDLRCRSR